IARVQGLGDFMISRRVLLESGVGLVFAKALSAQGTGSAKVVFQRDVPDLTLKNWSGHRRGSILCAGRELGCPPSSRNHYCVCPRRRDPVEKRGRACAG